MLLLEPLSLPWTNLFFSTSAYSISCSSTQVDSAAGEAGDGAKLMPSLSFGDNIIAHDKASVSLGSWDTVHLNHQVTSIHSSATAFFL